MKMNLQIGSIYLFKCTSGPFYMGTLYKIKPDGTAFLDIRTNKKHKLTLTCPEEDIIAEAPEIIKIWNHIE